MNTKMAIAWVGLCLGLAGCGTKEVPLAIVCLVDGQLVETSYTFESFAAAVYQEHGVVDVKSGAFIKSRSVEVFFEPLEDGRLLAEQAMWVKSPVERHAIDPAVLFDLKPMDDATRNIMTKPAAWMPEGPAATGESTSEGAIEMQPEG